MILTKQTGVSVLVAVEIMKSEENSRIYKLESI